MKLDDYKCDRCGKTYSKQQSLDRAEHGVIRHSFDVCDECLADFAKFMEKIE